MEGLKYPTENKNNLIMIFINSDLYSDKIRKRFAITKDVAEKNGIMVNEIKLGSKNNLSQVFELIQLGAYSNFYLSILEDQDPAPIPWVDYFKVELAKE
jgi:hypothetical protein